MADEHEEEHKPPEEHHHEEHKEGEAPKKGMSAEWKNMPKWEKAGIIIGGATLVFLVITWWSKQNSQNSTQGSYGQLPIGVPPNTQSSDMWPPMPGPVPPGSTNPPPSGTPAPPGKGKPPKPPKPPSGPGGQPGPGGPPHSPPPGTGPGPHRKPNPGPGQGVNPATAGFNTLPQLLPNNYFVSRATTTMPGSPIRIGDWFATFTRGGRAGVVDLSQKYQGIQVQYGAGGHVWYKRPGWMNWQALTGVKP